MPFSDYVTTGNTIIRDFDNNTLGSIFVPETQLLGDCSHDYDVIQIASDEFMIGLTYFGYQHMRINETLEAGFESLKNTGPLENRIEVNGLNYWFRSIGDTFAYYFSSQTDDKPAETKMIKLDILSGNILMYDLKIKEDLQQKYDTTIDTVITYDFYFSQNHENLLIDISWRSSGNYTNNKILYFYGATHNSTFINTIFDRSLDEGPPIIRNDGSEILFFTDDGIVLFNPLTEDNRTIAHSPAFRQSYDGWGANWRLSGDRLYYLQNNLVSYYDFNQDHHFNTTIATDRFDISNNLILIHTTTTEKVPVYLDYAILAGLLFLPILLFFILRKLRNKTF